MTNAMNRENSVSIPYGSIKRKATEMIKNYIDYVVSIPYGSIKRHRSAESHTPTS